MLIQEDEKGHVIIGEAALHLALAEKEINVISLISELSHMATYASCDERLIDLSEARSWLMKFVNPGSAEKPVPFLQTIASLNKDKC